LGSIAPRQGGKRFMKLPWIVLVLILCVQGVNPALSQTPGMSGAEVKNIEALKGPATVVREYFAAYLAWLNYKFSKGTKETKPSEAVPDKSLDPNYVTRHFIEAYKKLMAENAKAGKEEVGILDHDPIICAQDSPDDMSKASIVVAQRVSKDAVVKVNLWGSKEVTPFIVKLKKQQEGWRINAILCPGEKHNIE
jgi:hypothetical protein